MGTMITLYIIEIITYSDIFWFARDITLNTNKIIVLAKIGNNSLCIFFLSLTSREQLYKIHRETIYTKRTIFVRVSAMHESN